MCSFSKIAVAAIVLASTASGMDGVNLATEAAIQAAASQADGQSRKYSSVTANNEGANPLNIFRPIGKLATMVNAKALWKRNKNEKVAGGVALPGMVDSEKPKSTFGWIKKFHWFENTSFLLGAGLATMLSFTMLDVNVPFMNSSWTDIVLRKPSNSQVDQWMHLPKNSNQDLHDIMFSTKDALTHNGADYSNISDADIHSIQNCVLENVMVTAALVAVAMTLLLLATGMKKKFCILPTVFVMLAGLLGYWGTSQHIAVVIRDLQTQGSSDASLLLNGYVIAGLTVGGIAAVGFIVYFAFGMIRRVKECFGGDYQVNK